MLCRQRIGQLVELAVHDEADLVKRQVDAMVGDASLRKVVGADALGTVARADQGFARGRFLHLRCTALLVLDARGQHGKRAILVLVLRAAVLAFGNNAGGQVGDAHGGLGLVDVLAAGTGGAIDVNPDVLGPDHHVVDGVGLRHYCDGASRRMNPSLRFGLRYALHAVAARLKLQTRIRARTSDAHDDFLVAAEIGRAFGCQFHLPAVALGKARVHAKQIAGKQC